MSRWLVPILAGGCSVATPPLPAPAPAAVVPDIAAQPRSWRPVTPAPFLAAAPLLLTDGTVMIQELSTENWWQLTPDEMGSYEHGTWSRLASMQSGYSPLYSANHVLPDGRVIVEGGEYLAGNFAFTTKGSLYDPLTNHWTPVLPPDGWQMIGDASGIVLGNGTFMLSSCCDTSHPLSLLDLPSLVWQPTGMGKADIHDEESWVMLWDGTILTVDANNLNDLTYTEDYDPATGTWSYAGDTPVQISDLDPDGSGSHEVGPNVLREDGTVLAIGGNGHNATYDPVTKTWAAAPNFPMVPEGQLDVADGPAAVTPSGNVLIATSPGVFNTPTHFFEYDGQTFTEVAAPPNAPGNTTYQQTMTVLPTGEILLTDFSSDVELYTPAPGYPDNAVPVITSAPTPVVAARGVPTDPPPLPQTVGVSDGVTPVANLFLGNTYILGALRMNGVTQGAYYGDDEQSYTNYPIVRLTYHDTQHVLYCRSHDHSTRAIGPTVEGVTQFDLPMGSERGLADLQIIANGIPSPPVLVNVK
jgi:hypothetical protein